jgi:toxin FitB
MFVLDTNVISALRRPAKAAPAVVKWAKSADADDFYVSVISILEIEIGILGKARKDPEQAHVLRTWFDADVLARFEDRILPIDTAVALRCAALHVPDRRPERDSLIAATALVHGMSVVTRNVEDFEGIGVPVVDPWAFQGS